MDSASSWRPQPPCEALPPIAHAPSPTTVMSNPVEPRGRVGSIGRRPRQEVHETPQVRAGPRRSDPQMLIRKARNLVVFFVALTAIGSGAAIGATRESASALGTGVVIINTNLRLEDTWAAGTGMVLTSSGRILTNNHVIAGATTIRVAVPSTGHRYAARVVGYDIADDVAVLQLRRATNLRTVAIGSSAGLTVGASVTAIGNSGGFGRLISAPGREIRVGRSITVQNDLGQRHWLAGVIETSASLRPGDSGGPLLDSAGRGGGQGNAGRVWRGGLHTAAAFGGSAYAIPIATAASVTRQIVAGKPSSRVHVGATAFLGIRV